MPTYEYACADCHRHTEAVQRFTDPPLTECPHCGGPLKRVFHPVGIVLKGSGFYSTDNRGGRKTPKEPPKTDSPKTDSSSSSETTPAKESSGAKPAAAKESKPSKTTQTKK